MQKVILVVDDDENLRKMAVRLLASFGFSALAAADTAQTLNLLASERIDAVLLDVVLGGENGWETLRRIRLAGAVPVVMMSGATMDQDSEVDASAMEAQAVLQKPFGAQELLSCLEGILGAPPAP